MQSFVSAQDSDLYYGWLLQEVALIQDSIGDLTHQKNAARHWSQAHIDMLMPFCKVAAMGTNWLKYLMEVCRHHIYKSLAHIQSGELVVWNCGANLDLHHMLMYAFFSVNSQRLMCKWLCHTGSPRLPETRRLVQRKILLACNCGELIRLWICLLMPCVRAKRTTTKVWSQQIIEVLYMCSYPVVSRTVVVSMEDSIRVRAPKGM